MEYQDIVDNLLRLKDSDVVGLWNEACRSYSEFDDIIYENNDWGFKGCFNSYDDLACAISKGEYVYEDKWFVVDVYGHVNSFNDINDEKSTFDFDWLANWIYENQETNSYLKQEMKNWK